MKAKGGLMEFPEELCVDVTMDDILNGSPGDPMSCAIAHAIEKKFNGCEVSVISSISIWEEDDTTHSYLLTPDAADFIAAYDTLPAYDLRASDLDEKKAILRPRTFCFRRIEKHGSV